MEKQLKYCPKCKKPNLFEDVRLNKQNEFGWKVVNKCLGCGEVIPDWIEDNYIYYSECKNCKKNNFLLTQADHHPEYYSTVGMVCECGEVVFFELPVN